MIVRDEELNLTHTLPTITSWADRVWVVDSGSTDRTVEVARVAGCEVVHHDWLGYARQKNWAIDNLDIRAPWILILDADEAVTPQLREAICQIAARPFRRQHSTSIVTLCSSAASFATVATTRPGTFGYSSAGKLAMKSEMCMSTWWHTDRSASFMGVI